jgi:uncharacterized protein (DUF1800 family)
VVVEKPANRAEAVRFLAQASFGAPDSEADRLQNIGYAAWLDEQLALAFTPPHRAHWDTRDAEIRAANASQMAGQDQVLESFWKQALTGQDQLRQRWVYALSQIFVISMADDAVGNNPRAVAAWMDMLGQQGFGTYRQLLEAVSRHPMMGTYLSHLRNQKANTRTGRVPDENYAREVMQLFSIGLVKLNEDGSAATGSAAGDTYTPNDITGMARVFTGWSWNCPEWPSDSCFFNGTSNGQSDPERTYKAMLGYPQFHSTEEKRFLGAVVPAQTLADPAASLTVALDTLAAHPNVGPFLGRQMIQRLVTSNPSPTYVRDIARVWNNNGSGVRGDLKAVLRAILMHPEARTVSDTSGKLREPVLRLAAFMRAWGHTSDTNWYRVGNTDNPGTALGQTPMRSPSVFNFYRPGYVAPGSSSAGRNLVAPELQIAHETTAAGYFNYMRDNVASGVGASNTIMVNGSNRTRRDLQADHTADLALADNPPALADRVLARLTWGDTSALRTEIVNTLGQITIPTSNQSSIDSAKRARVNTALLLVLASPEFQVQQ